VKRFQIPKNFVQRAVYAAVAVGLVFLLVSWDYWRVRSDNAELQDLRIEAAEQREQIRSFETTLAEARVELDRVRELERKVRIIANLPGAASVGGDGVSELTPLPEGYEGQPILPAGVPIDPNAPVPTGQGGGSLDENGDSALDEVELREQALSSDGAQHVHRLGEVAEGIASVASVRGVSLDELLVQLEDKRVRLASMPSVWPARGWLTSRFGPRVSPFTGRAQHHAGIDIAAAKGTVVRAPARGRVAYVGRKGPLGNALVIDHGFGVRTVYGHNDKVLVKVGDTVERGDEVSQIGTSGRSTGPHLHYVVEVNGKPKDPLDYIFD
jgi:murein DD-endopeptidase MepM/ murein hydrolase activator NlpD